jgi:hypothetical protein
MKKPRKIAVNFKRRIIPFLLFPAAACTAPNHLGNPLLLPVHAITSGVQNAAYGHERATVKSWIIENEVAMRAEGFEGPITNALLKTLPAENRRQTRKDLKEAEVHSDFIERATVIIMVHRA